MSIFCANSTQVVGSWGTWFSHSLGTFHNRMDTEILSGFILGSFSLMGASEVIQACLGLSVAVW